MCAKSHEIRFFMGTSSSKWKDVMDLCCWRHPSFLETLFAQRMGLDVTVADAFPGSPVALFALRISLILFIPGGFLLCMLLTKPILRQLRATWMRAGSLGFPRHRTPPLENIKSPRGFPRRLLIQLSILLLYNALKQTLPQNSLIFYECFLQ